MEKYLEDLNEMQKEAVLRVDGPLLIVAGAGAGKTKTITHRIIHLIHKGINPGSILAITFTNKAAKEMRDRVFGLISNDPNINRPITSYEIPFISTFHALGVNILRAHAKTIGLSKRFTIYDKSDSKQAIKNAIKSAGLDPKEYEPAIFLSIISKEKGNNTTLLEFKERGFDNYFTEIVATVWEKYEDTLNKENALDFDDLLLKTVRLLHGHPEVLKYYHSLWHYIHVDEYQDTNKVQYEIMHLLAGNKKNICVVGDVDQNIYSWRGADIRNLLRFEKDFPGTKVITLEENYRSSEIILKTANAIIKKNKNRFEKNLFTKKTGGERLSLFEAFDENDEAIFVRDRCQSFIESGIDPKKIAVLYRANFQSRVLEEKFLEGKVPYQVLGIRFFERKEVKDVLSFLRASINPDSLGDLKRVINMPPRGIGQVTITKIFLGKEELLSPAHKKKWGDFRGLLTKTKEVAETRGASEVVAYAIKQSGIGEYLKEEDEERYENVMELLTIATRYDLLPAPDGVLKLLEDAALLGDQDELSEDKNGVRLMTVHASKGLEFEYVFIVGLEQDLFPHGPVDNGKREKRDEEEERRLFYVALTRARLKIFLSWANARTLFGSRQFGAPSEFIFDIPEELIDKEKRFEGGDKIIYLDL